MKNRIAVYAGSFDPPTLGHLDLVARAAKIFDKVIVAVAQNEAKQALFSVPERLEMLHEMTASMKNIQIAQFRGLTVDFARKHGAVALIRGLRVVSDFEFELSMAINNQKLNPDVDTVCLMPSEPYLFLSSRQVKEIASFGGKVCHYVTPEVESRLRAKFADT
ncbi:MAG: pantetheine-phosphate adenylyltransferase [Candidatus Hydrogenedentes bacterium]|nr:pantetheine-phosphate adenylyltransferase [Candidatus Hydrogenedentota bacterium]